MGEKKMSDVKLKKKRKEEKEEEEKICCEIFTCNFLGCYCFLI